jgi:hypothetical protein
MTELVLELDGRANATINSLMQHYGLKTKAELFSKALSVLKIAAYVEATNGELVARRGSEESRLKI